MHGQESGQLLLVPAALGVHDLDSQRVGDAKPFPVILRLLLGDAGPLGQFTKLSVKEFAAVSQVTIWSWWI